MESEHALIDPALEALERAFDDREVGRDEVAGRIDDLLTLLAGHLGQEEDAFPLMRAWLTTQEWAAMNKASMKELSAASWPPLARSSWRGLRLPTCAESWGSYRRRWAGAPVLVKPPVPTVRRWE